MPRGREGGRGTFGTHKPCSRAGVQYGMGYMVREGLERPRGQISGSFLGPMKRLRCYMGGDRDPQKVSQEGERDNHVIKVNFYKGHSVTVVVGLSRLRMESGKVVRKELDHCRREIKIDGWWHQKWRGDQYPDPVYGVFTLYPALCPILAHIVLLLLPITL